MLQHVYPLIDQNTLQVTLYHKEQTCLVLNVYQFSRRNKLLQFLHDWILLSPICIFLNNWDRNAAIFKFHEFCWVAYFRIAKANEGIGRFQTSGPSIDYCTPLLMMFLHDYFTRHFHLNWFTTLCLILAQEKEWDFKLFFQHPRWIS